MLWPVCLNCRNRPAKPLIHPLADDDDYICTTCRYPNCTICNITERPHNGKYRCYWSREKDKLMDSRPNWKCGECRGKEILAELKERDTAAAAASSSARGMASAAEPAARTEENAESHINLCGKQRQCAGCKGWKQRSEFRSDTHRNISSRCRACEFPVCGSCGGVAKEPIMVTTNADGVRQGGLLVQTDTDLDPNRDPPQYPNQPLSFETLTHSSHLNIRPRPQKQASSSKKHTDLQHPGPDHYQPQIPISSQTRYR